METKIELKNSHKIIAEINYNRLFKKNKLIQWIKSFNTIWKFEFVESKQNVYSKRR